MSVKDLFFIFPIFIYISRNMAMDFKSMRVKEGYPVGLLSDCPGSTKEAIITKSSLKYLSFILFSDGDVITAKREKFNYFQMKDLAKKLDFRKKTVVFMNGYMDSAVLSPISSLVGTPYVKLGYNVLLLEYHWFTIMIYPQAARFLKAVGKGAAEMLVKLSNYGLDPKKLELAGISLGGHGIGFIGKNYRRITGRNISRITGLDPSGPCFRHVGPDDRIDASDADFVDIIHCNLEGFGLAAAIGHVDYYVNGGEFQLFDLHEFPCDGLCSHGKTLLLWISALQHKDHFKAIKCETIQDARDRNCYSDKPVVNLMGLKANRNETGIFYLATINYYPYFMGDKGLKRENDPYMKYVPTFNAKDVMVI